MDDLVALIHSVLPDENVQMYTLADQVVQFYLHEQK